MYKIIGADGRHYGPVSAEQLRQWIAEGRANAQTRAQVEGSGEEKTLGEFAEFADLFAGPPVGLGTMPPPLSGRRRSVGHMFGVMTGTAAIDFRLPT